MEYPMTRTQALEALKVYGEWTYDTTIELWPKCTKDKYIEVLMEGLNKLEDAVLIRIGEDAMRRMENPVGMLVNQLREMQRA
jgi:hypothetical protein